MSTVCSSKLGGGQLKRKRSWPFWAETSAAARALSPARPMLSTVTSVSFFWPHSLTYVSLNHLSKAGTKCTHWRIFRLFLALAPYDRAGTIKGAPIPAANVPAAVVLIKSRRVICLLAMDSLLSACEPRLFLGSQLSHRSDVNLFFAKPTTYTYSTCPP